MFRAINLDTNLCPGGSIARLKRSRASGLEHKDIDWAASAGYRFRFAAVKLLLFGLL